MPTDYPDPLTTSTSNPEADPQLRALVENLNQSLTQIETEFTTQQQIMRARLSEPMIQTNPVEPADPAQIAEYEQMEAQYGASITDAGIAANPSIRGTAADIIHAAETVANEAMPR